MLFDLEPLKLPAEPRSVQTARQWAAEQCSRAEREDLSECAELGVSELVTNALLHGGDPITVRMSGTRGHPRFEVTDGSSHPPVLPSTADGMDHLLTTFGRGLEIVARCSTAWGATIEPEGKVVWFEPSPHPQEGTPPSGELFDLAPAATSPPVQDGSRVSVRLLGLPVATTLGLRRHRKDLHREVRLLSFAHEEHYPLTGQLTQAFARFDAVYPAEIDEAVDRAAANGTEVLDLHVQVPTSAAPVFRRMTELLDLADEFCRSERLLSLARSPHQRRFQEWLFGELVSQADGRDPVPWVGREETSQA